MTPPRYTVSFPSWLFTTLELDRFAKRIHETAELTKLPLTSIETYCLESISAELAFRLSDAYKEIAENYESILAETPSQQD